MWILAFGIVVLIGTVVMAAYGSQSWLCFWEQVGQAKQDK